MDLHSQVRVSRNEVQKRISHCCEIQCGQEQFYVTIHKEEASEGRFRWINNIEKLPLTKAAWHWIIEDFCHNLKLL